MRSLGFALVLFAVLSGAALGAFATLHAQGTIAGPDSALAEIVGGLLPFFHLVLAWIVLRSGAAMEPVLEQGPELPFRISSPQGKSIEWTAKVLAVWSVVTIALAFAFIVSLYPRSWSDAWICEQTGPGETSCDLVDGTFLQNLLFGLGAADVSLFLLGGSVAFVVMLRDARRTVAMPPTIVELSQQDLLPGVPFEAVIVQHGTRPLRSLTATIRCTESCEYASGSSTSTDTAVVHEGALARRENVTLARGRPLRMRFLSALPAGAMHTFAGTKNKIGWTFVVEAVSDAGRIVRQELPIVVGSEPDARLG